MALPDDATKPQKYFISAEGVDLDDDEQLDAWVAAVWQALTERMRGNQ